MFGEFVKWLQILECYFVDLGNMSSSSRHIHVRNINRQRVAYGEIKGSDCINHIEVLTKLNSSHRNKGVINNYRWGMK